MEECKPIGVPLDPEVKLHRNANENDEKRDFHINNRLGP
jgi:hypothetical protein